jgi:hypothetical protein
VGSTPSEPGGAPTGYIRGAAGVGAEPRSVAAVVVGFTIAVLAILAIALTVQAAHENSRHDVLHDAGVPVSASVTRCVGLAGGTGITSEGFTCYASFSLGGVRRTDQIRGSTAFYRPGDVLAAVVDPHHTGVLATRSSVATDPSPWHAYIAAGIVLALLAIVVAASSWRSRRRQVWRRPLVGASI